MNDQPVPHGDAEPEGMTCLGILVGLFVIVAIGILIALIFWPVLNEIF